MPLRFFFSTLCFFLTFQLTAQQTFNPNNVLIISKEGAKRPGLMRSGTKVVCKLKNGDRVKGDILVYSDHILVESKMIQFHEIAMIKPNNRNRWKRQGSGLIINEVQRRTIGDSPLNTFYWIKTGLFTALNFTLLEKKYVTAQGWEFKVQEFKIPSFARTD